MAEPIVLSCACPFCRAKMASVPFLPLAVGGPVHLQEEWGGWLQAMRVFRLAGCPGHPMPGNLVHGEVTPGYGVRREGL